MGVAPLRRDTRRERRDEAVGHLGEGGGPLLHQRGAVTGAVRWPALAGDLGLYGAVVQLHEDVDALALFELFEHVRGQRHRAADPDPAVERARLGAAAVEAVGRAAREEPREGGEGAQGRAKGHADLTRIHRHPRRAT